MSKFKEHLNEAKKLSDYEVGEIINAEGLGYAIKEYLSWKDIENGEIARYWRQAAEIDEFNGDCPVCNYPLDRVANTKSFKLLYDNKKDSVDWDGNRSAYYDEYNRQKAEGKDVRIAELD